MMIFKVLLFVYAGYDLGEFPQNGLKPAAQYGTMTECITERNKLRAEKGGGDLNVHCVILAQVN